MNQKFQIVIKPIKEKVKETDPEKIEVLKEKRRLQREARKNKPKEPKEPKIKVDHSENIENINKSIKNIIGFSIDEINEKLRTPPPTEIQIGTPIIENIILDKPLKKGGKKSKKII